MRKPLALAVVAPLALIPFAATPSQAASFGVVNKGKLERSIEKGYKKNGIKADAKCPKDVSWVKGKTFTCKVVAKDGTKSKVSVTLKSGVAKGNLDWEKVA